MGPGRHEPIVNTAQQLGLVSKFTGQDTSEAFGEWLESVEEVDEEQISYFDCKAYRPSLSLLLHLFIRAEAVILVAQEGTRGASENSQRCTVQRGSKRREKVCITMPNSLLKQPITS